MCSLSEIRFANRIKSQVIFAQTVLCFRFTAAAIYGQQIQKNCGA